MKNIRLFGLVLSLPMLVWQLVFFAFPLLFLVALSFWQVRNFRLEPAFDTGNWRYILHSELFWTTYVRSWLNALAATLVASVIASGSLGSLVRASANHSSNSRNGSLAIVLWP